ncbi:hypothetical protein B0H13DRAFT_1906927 [Mycena leptocephala]|nr:hypothetical protein B0H13DRAFT_1906927 [Mycena leptocephala]
MFPWRYNRLNRNLTLSVWPRASQLEEQGEQERWGQKGKNEGMRRVPRTRRLNIELALWEVKQDIHTYEVVSLLTEARPGIRIVPTSLEACAWRSRGEGEGDGDGVGERSPALSLSLRWRKRTRMSSSQSPERREFRSAGLFSGGEQERQDSYERTRNAEMSESGMHRVPISELARPQSEVRCACVNVPAAGLRHEVGRCNVGTESEEGNGAGTDWDADADADRRTVGGRKKEQTKRVLRTRRSAFAASGS